MLSASSLNRLRRDALDALYEARAAIAPRAIKRPDLSVVGVQRRANPGLCVRFASFEQWKNLPEISFYSLPAKELLRHPECVTERAAAEVPALVYPEDEAAMTETLKSLKTAGVRYALAENIGALRMIRTAGLAPVGGYGLNATNSDAIEAYRELGVCALFASFELTVPMLRDLKSRIPLGMIAAGRLPLMQLRACPARSDQGCGSCDGHPFVGDRKNAVFPLVCAERKYSTLLNCVPLYVADRELPPLDYYAVYLTTETASEAEALVRKVSARESDASAHTAGLAFRKLL